MNESRKKSKNIATSGTTIDDDCRFSVNNANKRLPILLRWLKQSKPDVVCLQELKCEAVESAAKKVPAITRRSGSRCGVSD